MTSLSVLGMASILTAPVAAATPAPNSSRKRLRLDDGWRYTFEARAEGLTAASLTFTSR